MITDEQIKEIMHLAFVPKGTNISWLTIKAIADAAHEKGKTELAVSLGLYENELGFCEISNHVPYSSLKE